MRRVYMVGLAALIALLAVPVALAQTPADQVYGGQAGNVEGDVAAGSETVSGVLPFTGLDLVLMTAAALMLVGAGLTMRRLARAKS